MVVAAASSTAGRSIVRERADGGEGNGAGERMEENYLLLSRGHRRCGMVEERMIAGIMHRLEDQGVRATMDMDPWMFANRCAGASD